MFKVLNKEFVIKKSVKGLIIETLCSTILGSFIIYLFLTEGNKAVTLIFEEAAKQNIELNIVLILFFPLLITIGCCNAFVYIINNNSIAKKSNKRK